MVHPAHIGDLLSTLSDREPEAALLSAAAVLALHQRAGRVPATDLAPLPEPAPPETFPLCSPRANQRLAQLLDKGHRGLLQEWLKAVAAAGRRVSSEWLPRLLEAGEGNPTLAELIRPTLGQRSNWLADQNPAWQHVVLPVDDEATWRTGSRGSRFRVLQRLRQQDPSRARTLLAGTWDQEPPKRRAFFLGAFADGLSLDDEPFLEAALDDRDPDVRRNAALLLRALPEAVAAR